MQNFRPIIQVIGLLLTTLGVAMLLPALVDLEAGHPDWQVFLVSSAATIFFGLALCLTTWGGQTALGLKEAFVLTTLAWVFMVAFAAILLCSPIWS